MDIYLDPKVKIPKGLQRRSRFPNSRSQEPQYQTMNQSNYQTPQQFKKADPFQNSSGSFIQQNSFLGNSNIGRNSLISNNNQIKGSQIINKIQNNLSYNQYNPFNTLDKFQKLLANNCKISVIVFYVFVFIIDLLVLCAHDYYKTGGNNILYLDTIFLNFIKILLLYIIIQSHWTQDTYEFDIIFILQKIFRLDINLLWLFIMRIGLIMGLYYYFISIIEPYYDPLNLDIVKIVLFILNILLIVKMFTVYVIYDQQYYNTSYQRLKLFVFQITKDYLKICICIFVICFGLLINNESAYQTKKNVFTLFQLRLSTFLEETIFLVYYFFISFYLYAYLSRFAKIPNVIKVAKNNNLIFQDILFLLQQCSLENKKNIEVITIEFQIIEYMIKNFSYLIQNKFNFSTENNLIATENIKQLLVSYKNDINRFQQALDNYLGNQSINRSQLNNPQTIFSLFSKDSLELKNFFYSTYYDLQIQIRKLFFINSISRNQKIVSQLNQASYELKNYFDSLENVHRQLFKIETMQKIKKNKKTNKTKKTNGIFDWYEQYLKLVRQILQVQPEYTFYLSKDHYINNQLILIITIN